MPRPATPLRIVISFLGDDVGTTLVATNGDPRKLREHLRGVLDWLNQSEEALAPYRLHPLDDARAPDDARTTFDA